MRKSILVRSVLILVVILVAFFSIWTPGEGLHLDLALDLQGGVMFILRVDTKDAVAAETSQYAGYLRSQVQDEGVANASVKPIGDKIEVRIGSANPAHKETVESLINDHFTEFEYDEPLRDSGDLVYSLNWKPRKLKEFKEETVRTVENNLRNRIDEIGVQEPNVTTQPESSEEAGARIVIQLPGLEDREWAKEVLRRQAYLEWLPGAGEPEKSAEDVMRQLGGTLPENMEILPELVGKDNSGNDVFRYWPLRKEPIVTGGELKYARLGRDDRGGPAVSFYLKATAANRFWDYTGAHKGERLVIVLDKKVISAPVIQAQISDSGIIEGQFSQKEAETLSMLLRSGALPAKPIFLHENHVGPTLGADAKSKGIMAAILGLAVAIAFVTIYYKLSGFNAVASLLINMVLILGAMAMLKAKMSLPGIAGLILSIGMAIDANILIFERIREELDFGKTVRASVMGGFQKAMVTILDSNITTIISGVFLFNFGTGPIKGFAIVLIIGIVASLFTAIFVSRTIYMILFKLFPGTEKKEFVKALI
jgi:preprotein translocase subunit SecD